MNIRVSTKGQAMPGETIKMGAQDFQHNDGTSIYWLGNASLYINSHGTKVMIDPLLEGFDMPLLIDMPILPNEVPSINAVLITHIDNDHFSRPTCTDLKDKTNAYYAPNYVADVMNEEGYPTTKLDINDTFTIKDLDFKVTPARHNWQNGSKKWQYRYWEEKDYCGYWINTKDGTIWLPGDSQLMDEHLHMEEPDVILFDFADNPWHITFEGAVTLANTYPNAKLICIHWGCVDAPDMTPFAGDPRRLLDRVTNPERVIVLAPGGSYKL